MSQVVRWWRGGGGGSSGNGQEGKTKSAKSCQIQQSHIYETIGGILSEALKSENEVRIDHEENCGGTEAQDSEESGHNIQGAAYIRFCRRRTYKESIIIHSAITYRQFHHISDN